MAIYRKEWKDTKGTGWNYRFDIVPYDETLSGTVTTLSGAEITAVEVGAVECGYNELPYGLQEPWTMSIKLAISNLPAALQTRLRNKTSLFTRDAIPDGYRNFFMYFSDRGTNGVTYTLEFCGCQAKIAGTVFSKESGVWFTNIELVDALYQSMVLLEMKDIADVHYTNMDVNEDILYDVGFTGGNDINSFHDSRGSETGWSNGFVTNSFFAVTPEISKLVTAKFEGTIARSTNTTLAATTLAADANNTWENNFFDAAKFFKPAAVATPRTAATLMTSSDYVLITHIRQKDSANFIGGMVNPADKYSWAKYATAWDWMKDLTENLNLKASYQPVYNAGGGNPYVNWAWSLKPILASPSGTTKTITYESSTDIGDIEEGIDSVGRVEVRCETESKTDVNEFIVKADVTRSDRTFTARIGLHNMQTVKPDSQEYNRRPSIKEMKSIGLFQTNLLCCELSGNIVKVHETVRLYKTASTYVDYAPLDPDTSLDYSLAPPNLSDSNSNDEAVAFWTVWVNATQMYGSLPFALATHLTAVFGQDNIASFECVYRINEFPTKVLNENLGEVMDMSASLVASELTHLAWTKAVVLSVSADHSKNTSTIKFMLIP